VLSGKKILGLVTARGGSKRLPRKNVLPFNGDPLIAWTIRAGLGSMYLDKVIVSSEDKQIQRIAVDYYADLVIDRPQELASDSASSVDVALHALDHCADQGETFDYLVLLQPTSPLRESRHIDDALVLMKEKAARAVVGVCMTEHPTSWMGKISPTLSMDSFIEHGRFKPEDRSPEDADYQINGAVYVIEVSELRARRTFFPAREAYAYIMSRDESVDVDTHSHFLLAESLHRIRSLESP
jgi:CMP-N-acetylneuraminic acid synthetase